MTYASLPADANADRTSEPPDILSHIDCCLNGICTPPYGDYSCDIDHDTSVDSSDLLRLIDLLNGAGTYIVWNYKSLPPNTCPSGGGAMAMSSEPGISADDANAVFIAGFVDYLTSVTLSDREATADFELIADGLTRFSLEWLSRGELDLLADALIDPSVSYASPAAAAKAREIANALTR